MNIKIIINLFFIGLLTCSCSYTDRIGDEEIKVIGNIYLLKVKESQEGFTLVKKIDENSSTYIIGDKVIKLSYNNDVIYAVSVFHSDTSYYNIPYNGRLTQFKANKIKQQVFAEIISKSSDLIEIKIPK